MSARLLAATLAAGTALGATGLSAQDIRYEDGQYLYAQAADPVLSDDPVVDAVLRADAAANEDAAAAATAAVGDEGPAQPIFAYDPVVQPIPTLPDRVPVPQDEVEIAAQPMAAEPMTSGAVRSFPAQQAGASYAPAYTPTYTPAPSVQAAPTYAAQSAAYPIIGQSGAYPVAYSSANQGGYGYSAGTQAGYLPGGGQLVSFDRNAWLAECRARLATYEDSDRARLIGTLAGAAAGGLIGNRVAGRGDRLAGTLLGAGAGAVVGSVAGDAIDDRNDARAYADGTYADDGGYCQAYLDDYMARASQGGLITTTVPGQQYFLVPVTVSVAQEPVYGE